MQTAVDRELLKHVYPLNQLPDSSIDELLPELRLRHYKRGEQVFTYDESPADYFYVVTGALGLEDRDGKRTLMRPVADGECTPLPHMVPSPHRAHAISDSTVLLVARQTLVRAIRENRRAQATAVPATEGTAQAGVRPERVLLVEDHATDARIAQLMLRGLGYESDWVTNCDEALSMLETGTHSTVLLDVQLPGVDGLETTRRIRERFRGRQLRIIALTARALAGARDECLAAGMDDYVPKPIAVPVLAAKLSRENWILVDAPVVERLGASLGATGVVQLIDVFLASYPQLIGDVRSAIQGKDAGALKVAAHSLKAAAQTLGLRAIADYALKLEQLGKTQTLDGAAALLGQIDSVHQETELALGQVRARLAA
jgi:CheY-like chemotaxis protein